ncbi:hypothetical protein EUX98_g5566 [Antrodiella citrinella]|uniref:HMG box domain-containing protein n=1 Tax=Antrodiella citrinella TaxID=2447956 RepID=A0A4S4MR96_9APHY|nr:hypothetical protein EUX98_g5566 [Antrodiella citrinella]
MPRKPKPDGPIPRPRNAWLIFRCEASPRYRKTRIAQSSVSQLASLEWKSMDYEARLPYFKKAEVEKAKHMLKYPDYKYNPKSKEQKETEKRAAQEQKRVEAEQRREDAKRRKISESHFVANSHTTPYVAASVMNNAQNALVPALPHVPIAAPMQCPPSPSAKDAPRRKSRSPPHLLAFPDALTAMVPPYTQEEQWAALDPSLEPSSSSQYDGYQQELPMKRTHEEMTHRDAANMALSLDDYTDLDDFVQSMVLGFPVHNMPENPPQPQPEQGEVWNNYIQPDADPAQFWDQLTDIDNGMSLNGGQSFSSPHDQWAQYEDPTAASGVFNFGLDLPSDFRPETFLHNPDASYGAPSVALTPQQDDLGMDMSLFDFSDCIDTAYDEQSVASGSSAPAPAPAQVFQNYAPPAGPSSSRRRVGGTWDFMTGSSRHPSY